MARRGFRIHSRALYDPFSYQELMAPIETAQSAYNQMQDNMLTLGEEANVYKQLIDTDPYASGILKGYNDTLADLSNKLSNEGLKSVNRNTLLSVRHKYNNEVKPVNDAAKTLMGIQDMYRQAYAKDNTLMRGAMPSIRDLVENPGAMPHMVSGTSLYNQGAQAAKSASVRKQNFSAKVNELVRGYIHTVNTAGYNSVEAQQFLDEASRQPELQAIVNQIYGANQVGKLDNPQQGMDWIVRGVFDGLTYEQKDDLKYDQYAAEMRAAARAAASAKGAVASNATGLKPFNLYSQKERNAARDIISRNQNKTFRIKADGSLELTEQGRREFNNRTKTYEGTAGGQMPWKLKSDLEEFYGKPIKTEEDYANAWAAYYNQHENDLFDARKATGYRYVPQADDVAILNRLMMGHSNNGEIRTVDFDSTSGRYLPDGKIKAKEIAGISDIEMTPYGFAMNVWTKDNKEAKVELPPIGGERMNYMHNLMTRINDQQDQWVQLMDAYGLGREYIENPEAAINLALSEGDRDAATRMWNIYAPYSHNIQLLHDEMANVYRPEDSTADKR